METLLEKTIFAGVDPPNLKITAPRWFTYPSPMQVFFFVMVTYFLVTGGIVYDVINEPPSIGSTVDEKGQSRPVAIMPYRVNGQYIMEGLVASFMYCLGGIGLILLDKCNGPMTTKTNRMLLFGLGFGLFLVGFFTTRAFMRMKLPDYMSS